MSATKRRQVVVTWIFNEETRQDRLVIIHSRTIEDADVTEADRLLASATPSVAWLPMVFLDPQLDNPQTRSWLQAEALHRAKSATDPTPRPEA